MTDWMGEQPLVLKHVAWRHLVRELAGKSGLRRFGEVRLLDAMTVLALPATIAGAIARTSPHLIEKESIKLLVCYIDADVYDHGAWFRLLPILLSRPSMSIEVELIYCGQGAMVDSPLKPLFPSLQPVSEYVGSIEERAKKRPLDHDVIFLPTPYLSYMYDDWSAAGISRLFQNGSKVIGASCNEFLSRIDHGVLGCLGVEISQIVENPFYIDSADWDDQAPRGYQLSPGQQCWVAEAASADRQPRLRAGSENRLELLQRLDEIVSVGVEEISSFHQRIDMIGTEFLTKSSLDANDYFIYLLNDCLLRKSDGQVYVLNEEFCDPYDIWLDSEVIAAFPGNESAWIERAMWATQTYVDFVEDALSERLLPHHLLQTDALKKAMGAVGDEALAANMLEAFFGKPKVPVQAPHKPLVRALQQGNFDAAWELMKEDHGLIEALDENSATPIFHFVRARRTDIISWLISQGANLNHQDGEFRVPIMDAATMSGPEMPTIIELLAAGGADVDAQTRIGWTACALAFSYRQPANAKKLLQLQANPLIPTGGGMTAAEMCRSSGYGDRDPELVEVMENAIASAAAKTEKQPGGNRRR